MNKDFIMKKLLIGLTLLASISSFANDCSVESVDNALVEIYNASTDRTNQIEIGGIISNFEHVTNFLPALEWHLATEKCPQFTGHSRRRHLKNLFRGEIRVTVIDERGVQFEAKRKRTTTEIAQEILNN